MRPPKIFRPFGPTIYSNVVDDDFFELLQIAKVESEKINQQVGDKLAGFIKQQIRLQLSETQHNRFCNHILQHVTAYTGMPQNQFSIPAESIWMNMQKPNEFNPVHIHEGEISGVIYLEIPKSMLAEHYNSDSNITFNNFGDLTFYYGSMGNRYFHVTPEERQILLFPAGLDHGVFPFYSDAIRVSIAFNIFKK